MAYTDDPLLDQWNDYADEYSTLSNQIARSISAISTVSGGKLHTKRLHFLLGALKNF